jgi:hypothetical protein
MALEDLKVSEIYSGRDIASLSDRPKEDGISTANLKARFDQLNKEVIPNYNDLIDLLKLILEDGTETNGHTHSVDNLVDGVVNRFFTEILKLKLDGIEEEAEVNQNAFSSIKIGANTGNADSKTSTFEIVAGLNINASINTTTNQITLSATGDISTEAVQSIIDDIGNYFTSLNVNGALQEIGAVLYPTLSKTTPHDDDTMLIVDSQASNIFKKLSWTNIKATLKTYFDGLYALVGHTHSTYAIKPTNEATATSNQILEANGDGTSTFVDFSGGGQLLGTALVKAIAYNSNTIAENITIPANYNASSVGTITIEDGYTVTLEDGAVWVII